MFELTITPGELDLATLRRVSREPVHVSLIPPLWRGSTPPPPWSPR